MFNLENGHNSFVEYVKKSDEYFKKIDYKPKCTRCKKNCIARNLVCINNCTHKKNDFCLKYNVKLEKIKDNLYKRVDFCFDDHVNNYLNSIL